MSPFSGSSLRRLCANAALILGCGFALRSQRFHAPWSLVIACSLVSASIVFLVETNWPFGMRPQTDDSASEGPPSPQETMPRGEEQNERRKKRIGWHKSLVQSGLVILISILTALLSPAPPGQPVNIGLSPTQGNAPNSKLASCQSDLEKSKAELQACKSSADLTKQLQQLTEQVQAQTQKINQLKSAQPQQQAGAWLGWTSAIGWIVVAVVALVAIAFVAQKHKEVVPIAGAGGLAAEVLKHASELSKLNDSMYWTVLLAYIGISFALLVLFIVAAARDIQENATLPAPSEPPDPHKETSSWWARVRKFLGATEEKKESYISSLGFSVVVLIWSVVIVAYQNAPSHTAVEPLKPTVEVRALPVLKEFEKGTAILKGGNAKVDQWQSNITTSPGDTLLLIGSTDCKPFRKGSAGTNATLAEQRAEAIRARLQFTLSAKGVQPLTDNNIGQHENCHETTNLRAVYPYLIHIDEREK